MTEAERLPPEQHVDQDDARYDGFRIREYWLLTAIGPDDQEGTVAVDLSAALRHHLPPGPAIAADQRRARHLRAFAREAAETTGVELRLRHFVPAGDDEVIRP